MLQRKKPTIYRTPGLTSWACRIKGEVSGLGAGPTPKEAYLTWLDVIAENSRLMLVRK